MRGARQMNGLQKGLHILSWLPLILLKITLALVGLIAVAIALRFDIWPRALWLWGNDEETPPPWFYKLDRPFPNWWWYAIRNPVNNFRYIFKDRKPVLETNWSIIEPMEAQPMINVGQAMAYRWAYRGPFAGYRRVWLNGQGKYSEFWIGWKIGSSVPGMGFTLQFRYKRKIGT